MRPPPFVCLPLVMPRRWRLAQALLAGCAAGVLSGWVVQRWAFWPDGWAAWSVAAVAAGVAGALGWRLARQRRGDLRWTGSAWQLIEPGQPPRPVRPPEVMLDLDDWMLLRLRDEARPRAALWRAAARAADRRLWASFRATVYSSASRTVPGSEAEQPPT